MRKWFFPVVLVVLGLAYIAVWGYQEGVVGDKGKTLDQSARSMADWYTMRSFKMSAVAANITVTTTYPGLILKGFYNNRRDSSVAVKVIFQYSGDTALFSVLSETSTGKIPCVGKILQSGTTDSLYGMFQQQ